MPITIQHRILRDPKPGEIVRLPAGSRLEVRFRRRGLGLSRWQVEDRPAHLVPLDVGDHGFHFLVFHGEGEGPQPLRLVRSRVDRPGSGEVRHLLVLVG
ncbi:hypothetical protein [Nocardioides sp. URHA0032]|uniref:hypothetical protein n=1 Tax=Nocardioides sp. URHA0032 TaxID=1380388 RepID=UPI00048C3F3F|nr:hypothetical protein [Nocardioides sp. URHA0032]